MKKEDKKSYYAVIPANVRYDSTLPASAKLLFGEITALCNEKGFCWASNSYFASLYGKDKGTISRWIAQLIEQGYLQAEVDKKDGNKRKLWLSVRVPTPIGKNDNTYRQKRQDPIGKNAYRSKQKSQDPIGKNANHNNKDNTTFNITDNNKKSSQKDLSSKEAEQHAAFSLLICRGVDTEVANSIVYDQHTPRSSIEEVIKNGLAKEQHARETGGKFRLEPGYIVKTLNQARKEGKEVGPTKQSKKLSAKIKLSKQKHHPLDQSEFEKRRRRQKAALGVSK
ncbi:MAG: hypothetical protein GWN55_16605 [Phycisphaerae bacterium]|nr:helix-turn-helix domain-containing protein [Phycisphaerae bacterium]NIS22537.1 helix-turn-helix domain-containing protein [candidate division KSB1 bacterium]NIP55109.1 helix-turn-helix domain-containing protein [Phycisphaerae bacterium]NIS49731.1 helix-turn-helix domain-containing protein [Phycisphaerae bacterium]NIU28764.1 helix-turn-helix domain-containing protein [candidate division KSB1 bacterium]